MLMVEHVSLSSLREGFKSPMHRMTLEPEGEATACKAVEEGSIPFGVSWTMKIVISIMKNV